MGIIKRTNEQLQAARRENERLTAELRKEKEKVQFLGLLLGDLDVDELFEEAEEDGE